jgi:pilus assembly protein CpaF
MSVPVIDPLPEIERLVQERAKALSLDLTSDAGDDRLRSLIEQEVSSWNDDARRGRRPVAVASPDLATERAFRNLARYGPLTSLLDDPDVWEIMVNAPDLVFVKRHVGPSGYHHDVFHDDDHVARTMTRLLEDHAGAHRKLDPADGLQDAQLNDGSRVHLVHRDLARGGHLIVNIRRFTGVAIRSLDELVDRGTLDEPVAQFLRAALAGRLSVVFAGPPGSGKTTLLSCCAAELDPALRVVVAEEVFETDVALPNVASMQTRPARGDRSPVDLRRLVAGFLRMAPDVAIVGEVRDTEALPLLLTLSSGVTGLTTMHAGSARQALSRLRFICQLSEAASTLSSAALGALVAESIDVVVHCRRTDDGPRVTEVVCVEDLIAPSEGATTITEVYRRGNSGGALTWTGVTPARAGRKLADHGIDLGELLTRSNR